MIIYTLPELKYLTESIYKKNKLAFKLGKAKFNRYNNGERHIEINEQVQNQNCLIMGSFTPPDEQIFKTLLLAHTLKKERANKVSAILPYLAYTRDDKNKQFKSLGTDWIGCIAKASGLDKIITIDLHSKMAESLIKIPIVNISPAELFLTKINKKTIDNVTIVAPDEGAKDRAELFRKASGISRPITYFKKSRRNGKIIHTEIVGETTGEAIIVDDILDTGGTLISCAEKLKKLGAKKITVLVTHGLFTGTNWLRLFKLNVNKILTTDSTPTALKMRHKKIEVIPTSTLLAKTINEDT